MFAVHVCRSAREVGVLQACLCRIRKHEHQCILCTFDGFAAASFFSPWEISAGSDERGRGPAGGRRAGDVVAEKTCRARGEHFGATKVQSCADILVSIVHVHVLQIPAADSQMNSEDPTQAAKMPLFRLCEMVPRKPGIISG